MAYINNGTNRSLYITIDKQVGGNQVQGYPVTYNGQNAFPGYLILTDEEVRQLSTVDFDTRYDAFEAYVESIEDGVKFDTDIVGDGATKYDPDVCLATTTTTYTTAAPVYAFSIKYGQYPVDVCSGTAYVVYSSVQVPVAGTILYKDLALTDAWDTTNGEHILFVSPVIYGELAVEVSLTTGAIVQVTTFDCGGVTPATTTTTEAGSPYYRMVKCDGTNCYLPQATKEAYEVVYGSISVGDQFYGAIDGDVNYLYLYTGQLVALCPPITCVASGITATTDTCP